MEEARSENRVSVFSSLVKSGLWTVSCKPTDEDKCTGLGSGMRKGERKAECGRERMLQHCEQKSQEE